VAFGDLDVFGWLFKRKKQKFVDENQLGILAMKFRGGFDNKNEVAKEYAQIVKLLINSGNWKEIPALEDQLPDEWMPDSFFEYWSLSPRS
jgi:hypothetical protein